MSDFQLFPMRHRVGMKKEKEVILMDNPHSHNKYYERQMYSSAKRIAEVCELGEDNVPASRKEVLRSIKKAMKYGNEEELAEVLLCAAEWSHAYHELCERGVHEAA